MKLFVFLILALAVAGCVQSPAATPTATPATTPTASTPTTHTIEITASGFSPNSLVVKAGNTVRWVNKADAASWPASAMHPTHRIYPGSGLDKCGTAEQASIFDTCKGLAKGESWSFKFNEKGTWAYHDHNNPSQFGRVIVE